MISKNKKLLLFLVTIFLPFFIISTPEWLKINGISPCWPIIWLLPFSLENSSWIAAIAAISLGIFIDSFTVSDCSYIPSFLFLSFVWSQYGFRNKKIEFFFNIGLMSIFGTAVVGVSIWAQKIFFHSTLRNNWFHSWSIFVLISEVIITGLVAPFFSSWLLLIYKKTNKKIFKA
tara:strand:+ start:540 stop:1061 length:522 start_codon:yes stop_codon:yes gene_type:complete